jgi:hypothetical protein
VGEWLTPSIVFIVQVVVPSVNVPFTIAILEAPIMKLPVIPEHPPPVPTQPAAVIVAVTVPPAFDR